jgi:Tfp pilus assembly protein PilF
MLYDPVKAVRIEGARRVTEIPNPSLDISQKSAYQAALADHRKSMEYSADFAFGRYNLGNLYAALKQTEESVKNYRAAIKIDNLFYPAKVNLAMLYNQMGKNDQAEILLREVATSHPEVYEVRYSLGLLLAEEKKYTEAANYLEQAAIGMPKRARIHYNLGLLQQHLNNDSAAEASFLRALALKPGNLDYLYVLADFYLKRRKLQKAKSIAEEMVAKHPAYRTGQDLLLFIEKNLESNSDKTRNNKRYR